MQIGEYKVEGEIGSGATSIVYKVTKSNGESYALKLMNRRGKDAVEFAARFRQEAAVLARIDHECVVKMYEIGEYQEQPYVIMPLLELPTLTKSISAAQLPEGRILKIAKDICSALVSVHRLNLIHRDLKPDNILSDENSTRLIDFGFVDENTENVDTSNVAGTILYSSPEQSGMLKARVDFRSDLYSLGAVIFECATGRPVFEGDSAIEILQKHAKQEPIDIRTKRSDLGPEIAAIVAKLLRKDPEDRYQSARGLLYDLENISSLKTDGTGKFVLDKLSEELKNFSDVPLVGRENELKKLLNAWGLATAGSGKIVQIEGEGGSGKSRLCQEVLKQSASSKVLILRAKCLQTAAVPFGAIREALDDYLLKLMRLPAEEKAREIELIEKAAGQALPVVAKLTKSFERVFDRTIDDGESESDYAEGKFVGAVADFICQLGKQRENLLLLVDDTQWIDQGSADILMRVGAVLQTEHILILTTARNDSASMEAAEKFVSIIQQSCPIERISLNRLDLPAIEKYCAVFLGKHAVDKTVYERLAAASGGNVFALGEYLRGLIESGGLYLKAGNWEVSTEIFHSLTLSMNVIELVVGRIQKLSEGAKDILRTAALEGNRVSISLLKEAFGKEEIVDEAIDEAIQANLVELADAGSFSFVHDRVRESILQNVTEDELKKRHQDLADIFSKRKNLAKTEVYSAAVHFIGGFSEKYPRENYEYCLAAGRFALENYLNEDAFRLLAHAAKSEKQLAVVSNQYSVSTEVDELLGTAQVRLGRLSEAQESFAKGLRNARTFGDSAKFHLLKATAYTMQGDAFEAQISLDNALQILQRGYFKNSFFQYVSIVWFALTAAVIYAFDKGKMRTGRNEYRDLRKAYSSAARIGSVISGLIGKSTPESYFSVREYLNSRFIDSETEFLMGYGYLAHFLCGFGISIFRSRLIRSIFSRERREKMVRGIFGRIIGTAKQIGDPNLIGRLNSMQSKTILIVGNIDEAFGIQSENFSHLKKYGGTNEQMLCLSDKALMMSFFGNAREVVQMYEAEMPLFNRATNPIIKLDFIGTAWLAFTRLGLGKQANKCLEIRQELLATLGGKIFERSPYGLRSLYGINIAALWANYDVGAELDDYIEKLIEIRKGDFRITSVTPLLGYIRLYQMRTAMQSNAKPEEVEKKKKAFADMIQYLDGDLVYDMRGHLYILKAAWECEFGSTEKAKQFLEAARKSAGKKQLMMQYEMYCEQARVLKKTDDEVGVRVAAQKALLIGHELGWVARENALKKEFSVEVESAASRATLSQTTIGAFRQVQVESYFEAVLRVSQATAASLDIDQQARSALDELVNTLSAERAFLFMAGKDGESLQFKAGRDSSLNDLAEVKGYSSTVVKKVFAEKTGMVVSGTEEGEVLGSESAVAHNLRSIMAAPMMVKDKTLGVIYLDSRVSKGLFDKEELKILSIIAGHIGVAIETAEMARTESERREMKKDLALTAAVQNLFLPDTSASETLGIKIHGYYQPASHASGDWWWYDFPTTGVANFLVADVTGHGAGPAMLTAATASYVKSLERHFGSKGLDNWLVELNDTFLSIAKGAYNMTMSAVSVDIEKREVTMWSAAAPPILILGKAGGFNVLGEPGTPLGSDNFQTGLDRAKLESGDRILIFTDGLPEMELSNSKELKMRGVQKILRQTQQQDLAAAVSAIELELGTMRGDTPLRDDITFVLIDCT